MKKRIVVKIGSNALTRHDGRLDVTRMSALVDQIAWLRSHDCEVILVSSGAFAGGPVKRLLAGADSLLQVFYKKVDYDTAYVSRSPGTMGLKAWGSLSGSRLRARGDNLKSNLRPDMKGSVSLEFDYYDLALEVATNLTGSSSGTKRDFEINFNFYPRRFVLDASYQKTWSAAGSMTYKGQSLDVENGWLKT